MKGRSMMKWRVRRDSHCSAIEHEDIRRSLDVLDSVLAEFDDCLESCWDNPLLDDKKLEYTDYNSNAVKSNDFNFGEAELCFLKCSRDSATSHISSSIVPEQPRVVSPPPIPKRSPATKLSDRRNVSVFTFPPENNNNDNSLDSFDSTADLSSNSDHVSQQRMIREPLSHSDCDDARNKCPADKCANCGRAMNKTPEQQQQTGGGEESPFHQRKQMFEARIAEASTNVSRSPSFNRSFGTSFKTKRLETGSDVSSDLSSGDSGFYGSSFKSKRLDTGLDVSANVSSGDSGSYGTSFKTKRLETSLHVSADLSSGDSGFEDRSGKNLSELSAESFNGSVGHHAAKCTCKDRIRQLNAKFSDVRRLIKLNKIRGLDSKPPCFVPPPPPIVSNGDGPHQTHSQLDRSSSSSKSDLRDDTMSQPKTSAFNDSSLDASLHGHESLRSASSINSLATSTSDLCNRCLSCLSVHTIEDLPKLLPTDALNRPHLGFSYSLEEDLPPGVKEIQQTTSTPKSDVSSPRLFRTKESNLSTFSHSASSLGYISSQSDLELNDLSIIPDKVPISSFKSRTLPNGLDRSPFYSSADDTFDKSSYYSVSEMNDHNRLSAVVKTEKSKSPRGAPLMPPSDPPHQEKTKTKHFRVFSRKSKKDKKRHEGTP